jgi:hypothetical protein
MVKPKKPVKDRGYLITFYTCPYCSCTFLKKDINTHIRKCYAEHRARIRRMCKEQGKKNFARGVALPHVRRKKIEKPKEVDNEN